MTQKERINILNILERLGAESYCGDCMFHDECLSKEMCIYDMAHDLIENDDSMPVIHGHWIRRPLEDECSECHNKYPHDYHLGSFASYCPMCGSVMENLGFTSFRKE